MDHEIQKMDEPFVKSALNQEKYSWPDTFWTDELLMTLKIFRKYLPNKKGQFFGNYTRFGHWKLTQEIGFG